MILSSPHVHTQFCDGRSSAEEMVLSALSHGCQSLGFSSHARQNFASNSAMSPEAEIAYIAEIHRLQQAYSDRIRIWLGIELDSYSCADTAPYDFIIGSVHYLPNESGFTAIDGASEPLCTLLKTFYKGDGIAMARDYYLAYGAMMRARRPQIGGHFDLIRKWNKTCHLFDENHPVYRQHALHALEAAFESGVVLEVNTGGMARYGAESPYPARLLSYCSKLDIKRSVFLARTRICLKKRSWNRFSCRFSEPVSQLQLCTRCDSVSRLTHTLSG